MVSMSRARTKTSPGALVPSPPTKKLKASAASPAPPGLSDDLQREPSVIALLECQSNLERALQARFADQKKSRGLMSYREICWPGSLRERTG